MRKIAWKQRLRSQKNYCSLVMLMAERNWILPLRKSGSVAGCEFPSGELPSRKKSFSASLNIFHRSPAGWKERSVVCFVGDLIHVLASLPLVPDLFFEEWRKCSFFYFFCPPSNSFINIVLYVCFSNERFRKFWFILINKIPLWWPPSLFMISKIILTSYSRFFGKWIAHSNFPEVIHWTFGKHSQRVFTLQEEVPAEPS